MENYLDRKTREVRFQTDAKHVFEQLHNCAQVETKQHFSRRINEDKARNTAAWAIDINRPRWAVCKQVEQIVKLEMLEQEGHEPVQKMPDTFRVLAKGHASGERSLYDCAQ